MIPVPGLNINFLKKESYSGSYQGMRYYFTKEDDSLVAYSYPDLWCFEQTADEEKHSKSFAFNADGLDEAIAWLESEFPTFARK